MRDLEIEVVLKVGADSFPFRTLLTLGENTPQFDLADSSLAASAGNPAGGVQVPLIAELVRSIDERMQTSLYVNVQWHDQILFRHTFPVSLSPVHDWRIDQSESCWLPSFIQPRDPAVSRIIDSAQKYLRCLEDYPSAGFRGYQADEIDPQVQAIWSAIIYDYRLDYINPPPSYSDTTQRLRTPSHVIEQGRGTCVDLAILFASCLEWIELYPVILMTHYHAFPGYWNSEDAHYNFVSMSEKAGGGNFVPTGAASTYPWISGPDTYQEISGYVDNLELIPLETVCLTERKSFQFAWEYARDYFDPDKEDFIGKNFESMVDIHNARPWVTPLPLRGPNMNLD